ncbi:hypothetical protein LTR36_007990 [Oleoguttula mirabilis]|uniref:Protein EFR3 n=1 Tax=Oleoguttula mirabilis TaxID=1507867 RepID=A0AAV9J8G7_9PEZI|nr:hypothetical protein LTR36_007990 [Oleoguttula mirabilis]
MTKTHLPAHMDSVRQKCRPKHQLLILKCYPRLPKNSSADVKPNGSELSYLLYYASTRSSKLHKVGAFLERKTASDVYKAQSARVLVTLQLMTALLDNKSVGEGSGFQLIAPYVMRIISGILQNTTDIGLIEATQTTWNVFCKHQDQAILAADHEYRELYELVVGQYAQFAHNGGPKKLGKGTGSVAVQDAIRLRETGLHATKSMLTSDALAFESGRQLLNVTVPAILSNLRGDDAAHVEHLVEVSKRAEDEEKDKVVNRRQSMATVRTQTGTNPDGSAESDPRAAEGTAQHGDEVAEEGVALVALDCLKAVFAMDNRAQVRSAASAVLNYLSELQYYRRPQTSERSQSELSTDSWATKIFELCTAWTPVQDRFILLVTTVETLVRLPLKESDMRQHLLYTSLIDHVLRSDLNLIGLSVMDVLLGLIQQALRVLQLASPPAAAASQSAFSNDEIRPGTSSVSAHMPSEARVRLMERLKSCIADLATHVYYTDQISDMLSAILLRLKPSPAVNGQQNPAAAAAAIEEPKSAVSEAASKISMAARERSSSSSSSGYFSFDTARQVALEMVRDILKVANSTRSQNSGGVSESRNPVSIATWEGTQWLLRDPCAEVRKAYADALITWLELETEKSDFRYNDPKPSPKKKPAEGAANGALSRRAVSNASASNNFKDRQSKKSQQTFLQLLHLANYENALQFAATSESDLVVINTLLTTLVQRLGLNAAASGLPMIFALQEEIARVESPVGKVRIGSLVHGYLWALVEIFDFEHEITGKAILQEIARRKEKSIWVREMQYPPLSLDAISERSASGSTSISHETVAHENLKPFDDRESLVDSILEYYQSSIATPLPAAPGSPGRSFSMNALDRTSSYLSAKQTNDPNLMTRARQDMMATWSRDECLAAMAAMAPKSVSLSGSRSSPAQALAAAAAGHNYRQLLAGANGGAPAPNGNLGTPPNAKQSPQYRQQAFGNLNNRRQRLNSQSPDRRPSASSAGKTSSSAPAKGPMRVEELKRVLANGVFTGLGGGKHIVDDDTTSESVVEVDDADLGSDIGSYRTSLRGGPGRKRPTTKKDLNALLDSIVVEEDGPGLRVAMSKPPYY